MRSAFQECLLYFAGLRLVQAGYFAVAAATLFVVFVVFGFEVGCMVLFAVIGCVVLLVVFGFEVGCTMLFAVFCLVTDQISQKHCLF